MRCFYQFLFALGIICVCWGQDADAGRKAKTLSAAKTTSLAIYQDALKREPVKALAADSPLRSFADEVSSVFAQREMQRAKVGFIVTSLKSNEVLAERDADMLLNPASNVKLVTTLAALYWLKPEYRFKTEYFRSGSFENGELKGDLIVKGYGDPTIVTERLQRVARELKLRGIKRIVGHVVLDDSYFDDKNQPAGWESVRRNMSSYAAPIGALSFNHNTMEFFIRPTQPKQPAFFAIEPPTEYLNVKGTIETSAKKRRPRIQIVDDGDSMRIQISGFISQQANPLKFRRRIFSPGHHFGSALVYFLEREGIEVGSGIKSGKVPEGAKLIWVDRSQPLSQVIGETNKYSSNFMAEMLVKAMGAKVALPASFENGLASIRQFLEAEVDFKKGEYTLGNGSGLNDVNRFSARQMTKLLAYANQNFEIASEFISSLGVAGTQGTLAGRMRHSDAERKLRAKTGTLNGVSALSGYVSTKDDDTLAFSILVQGHVAPTSKIWLLQDRIGESLAQVQTTTPELVEPEESIDEGWSDADWGESEEAEVPGG